MNVSTAALDDCVANRERLDIDRALERFNIRILVVHGGHYNPLGHEHGLDNPAGPHAGDLPNLVVNADGVGLLDATTDRVTLSAGLATLFDATGSAFIIHANPDDQVTDAGNGGSGARIGCAVIEPG